MPVAMRNLALPALSLLLACGGTPEGSRPTTVAPATEPAPEPTPVAIAEPGDPPLGQLPEAVTPTHYRLALTVVPEREGFSGLAEIQVQVAEPTRHIWLHGDDLEVAQASVTPAEGEAIEASWEQVDDEGVAILRLGEVLPAGEATIRIDYRAPFNTALHGLYKVEAAEEAYAFTQFEATSARLAFPGFDEPRFKTPFDVALTVQEDHVAAFNTPQAAATALGGGLQVVRFETTRPMPTYLVAMAVGPLDVVEHEAIPPSDVRDVPIPLRGLAVKGKGEQLAYALEHTAEILAALESYFGIAYPYRKLDIVAVPDFAAGAMENVGLIPFREPLLLLDEDAPERQLRGYAYVMAHELAHQWFGNLVTMPWWDDIWLNEAFATWMGQKVVRELYPAYRTDLTQLAYVHRAMRTDSLVSARQIREPIESSHDIRNAFDAITYTKGGGVLSMFEQWMSPEVFQRGIRQYMETHRWGTATYEDLLSALSEASGRDVSTPFRTFLFQPGLPFVEAELSCSEGEGEEAGGAEVRFSQQRYLPVGSEGDAEQMWVMPICVRYEGAEGTEEPPQACTLLADREGRLELPRCPGWILPNADGAGYLRFTLSSELLAKLRTDAWDALTDREKLALTDSLRAAFDNGSLPAADLYGMLEPLARSEIRNVAEAPMGMLSFAHDRLVTEAQRAAVRRLSAQLYQPVFRRLRWAPRGRAEEDGETKLLRAAVIGHLAEVAELPRVRREAAQRGQRFVGYGRRGDGEIHRDVVDANLVGTVLEVAVQDGDEAFFDHVLERFVESDDAMLRSQLLRALASTKDEGLAARARALALDPRVRVNEVWVPLGAQMGMPETREATWGFLQENFDALVERLESSAGFLPRFAGAFCSEEQAEAVQGFFQPRIAELPGGPRNLLNTLEAVRLCAAKVEAQQESARSYFGR